MTSVERARRFIQARGKAIAMTIVPLAAIAIAASQPARAANVLVFGSGGCNVTEVGVLAAPLAECSATPIPGFQNNANSIKLSGDSFVIFAGGSGSVTFDLNGGANGGIPSQGVLPVSWDFTVETAQQLAATRPIQSLFSYYLNYRLSSGSFSRVESGSVTSGYQCGDFTCADVTGTSYIGADGPVSSYQITLTVSGVFAPGAAMSIHIPNNSIDLNPPSPTPEPASMALGMSGLLGLAFAGFRRRRKA